METKLGVGADRERHTDGAVAPARHAAKHFTRAVSRRSHSNPPRKTAVTLILQKKEKHQNSSRVFLWKEVSEQYSWKQVMLTEVNIQPQEEAGSRKDISLQGFGM